MLFEIRLHQPFNLDFTLNSGQTFRWRKVDESWYGVIGSTAVKALQIKDKLILKANEALEEDIVLRYFGLKDDLLKIYDSIDKDQHIHAALKAYRGLRILKQDPWETLISFITATYTNIRRVETTLGELCRRFGVASMFNKERVYLFPTPQAILSHGLKGLYETGLGYRAPWILEAAKIVEANPDLLPSLAEQQYEEARLTLLNKKLFKGVGNKVADCILLFGYGKLEAFPIDRWVRRSLVRCYRQLFDTELISKLKDKSFTTTAYNKVRLKMIDYFGGYAGYAQQYLFTYERLGSNSLNP
ncbi:MAG: DNA glycosylase [Nitrososphaerales archaeon]